MAPRILPAFALIALLLGVSSARAGGKSDAEQILGVWKISKAEIEGMNPLPPFITVLMRVSFEKDGKLVTRLAGPAKEEKGSYKQPAAGQVDLENFLDDPGTIQAAVRFDSKDQMSICFSLRGKKRPDEITGAKGKGQALLIFQRTKPGDETPTAAELAKFKKEVDEFAKEKSKAPAGPVNNLKNIGLAFHSYHDQQRSLPRHAIYSKDGKTPLLSWRVAILPYLDEEKLYKEFKLDEPWDSPNNKKLISKMPRVYRAHDANPDEVTTPFQVFTGPNTVFGGAKGLTLQVIVAGTSNTIFAVEAKNRIVWTQPDTLKALDKLPALGGSVPAEFLAAMGDGTVQTFPLSITAAELRAKISPTGKD